MESDRLEEGSHFLGRGEAMDRHVDLFRPLRIGARERLCPRYYADLSKPLALRDDGSRLCASLTCRSCDRFEIDMGGQVLLAWIFKNGRKLMAADRLQRFSWCAQRMAIIDEESDAAMLRQVASDRQDGSLARR